MFAGELEKDPQRKLALLKPRLPNGECPPGFIGFAVNMILLDNQHKFCVTASGHGLRETLFYSLFSRLQVYKTRADMQCARPFITDGAISLDGAIIKSQGMLALGHRYVSTLIHLLHFFSFLFFFSLFFLFFFFGKSFVWK